MPKLKTCQFYARNRSKEGITFSLDVQVSQDGYFYCGTKHFPAEMKRRLPGTLGEDDKIEEQTLSGFRARVQEIIESFEELFVEETKEKVILYRVFLQGDLTPDLGGSEEGSRSYRDLDQFGDARKMIGFGVAWRVCFRFRILGRVRYTYGNGTEFSPHKEQEIVWTEARQAWFENLDDSLRAMMIKVDDFLRAPKAEELVAVIDNGARLLVAPEEKKR